MWIKSGTYYWNEYWIRKHLQIPLVPSKSYANSLLSVHSVRAIGLRSTKMTRIKSLRSLCHGNEVENQSRV